VTLLLVLLAPLLTAFSPPPQTAIDLAVSAGYGGYYRRDQWTPVRVTAANPGDDFSGVVRVRSEDGGGLAQTEYRTPLDLPRGSRKQVFVYVSLETYSRALSVEIVDRAGLVVAQRTANLRMVGREDLIYVVVTESALGAVDMTAQTPGSGAAYQASWRVENIPASAEALLGVDVLLVHDANTGALSVEQSQAIERWVLAGGHLIVAGGDAWQRTTAGLGGLLPVEPRGTQVLETLAPLAAYLRLPADALAARTSAVTGALKPGARALVSAGHLPLLARREHGAGVVDFLAVDPNTEPLRSWAGQSQLWYTLVASIGQQPSWAFGFRNWPVAREATLTLFRTVLPGFGQLSAFLLAYIVLIGPANYLVLRSLNKREWAWGTIPLLVVLFSVLAYNLGFNLRGSEPTVNRLAVVRVWPGAEQAQVTGLLGVQSARRDTYDLAVERGYALRTLPEVGLGLDVAAAINQETRYRASAVLIDAGTMVSFAVDGFTTAPQVNGSATWTLADGLAPRVAGAVTNQSGLLLRDAVLLIKGESRFLGDLGPGSTATFDIAIGPQDPGPLVRGSPLPQHALYTTPPWQFARNVPGWCFDYRGLPLTMVDVMRGEPFACASMGVSHRQQEIRRRYRLLASLAVDYDLSGGRDMGAYLFAWTDAPLVGVELPGVAARFEDTALIIVELPVTVEAASAAVEVPPGLTTWTLAATQDGRTQSDIAPARFEVHPDMSAAFQFMPMPAVRLERVDALELQFSGRGALLVELWDWLAQDWAEVRLEEQSPVTTLAPAARFVGPENAVNVRVSAAEGMAYNHVEYVRVGYRGQLAR
jgi:hypothetical protein